MKLILKKTFTKTTAVFLAVNMFLGGFSPVHLYALTSGPSQPEVQSFEPVGTTEMVDLFSGDFTYNIPLFELPGPNGGYPFNLAYHAGIGMDQEASWVGLGWNVNPGAMTRQMRGLPDDFNGDKVEKEMSMKPNITYGIGSAANVETFGFGKVNSTFTIRYNNYKGLGYSFSPAEMTFKLATMGNMTANFRFGYTFDSHDGPSFRPALSIQKLVGDKFVNYDFGMTFNSRYGVSNFMLDKLTDSKNKYDYSSSNTLDAISGNLSLAGQGVTPRVSMPMNGTNVNINFKLGPSFWGIFPNGEAKGFFTKQKLRDEYKASKSFGYLYLQNAGTNRESLLDFNREKEVMLSRETPNLGIPNLNYDIYSATGQGMSGMFRPYRTDVRLLEDQRIKSKTIGFSAGIDVGATGTKWGGNLSVSYGESNSGGWESENELDDLLGKKLDPLTGRELKHAEDFSDLMGHEYYYFKAFGEPTTSATETDRLALIGNEKPVKVKLEGSLDELSFAEAQNEYEYDGNDLGSINAKRNLSYDINSNPYKDRPKRNTVMLTMFNKDLKGGALSEFNIKYYKDKNREAIYEPLGQLDRTDTPNDLNDNYISDDHIGGYTVTNTNGLRYVYGLPVYNKENVEVVQSVNKSRTEIETKITNNEYSSANGTEEFLNKTTIPAYTYAHLLTSVLGSDYIDADDIPGPSEGDIGYWIKFTYVKTSDNYQWRAPFIGGNFIEGLINTDRDNKASYTYGEKEVYYLRKAESKSHVAVFELADRDDGRGANMNSDNSQKSYPYGDYQQKLREIRLYTRSEFINKGTPIKTVKFNYDYSLCPDVKNNANVSENTGKLTLKSLQFSYGKNDRASLSPYVFEYSERIEENKNIYNPTYDIHKYDRWGNYKAHGGSDADIQKAIDFPYVNQGLSDLVDNDPAQTNNKKAETIKNREITYSSWSLSKITLPSGGKIQVEYESDDYAYVQNKTAMQMTPIIGIGDGDEDIGSNNTLSENTEHKDRRVYFYLEDEIKVKNEDVEGDKLNDFTKKILDAYLDENEQVYFKVKMDLMGNDRHKEYVRGYANYKRDINGLAGKLVQKTPDASDESGYTYFNRAYINLAGVKVKKTGADKFYHPFSLAAWQHISINEPELLGTNEDLFGGDVAGVINMARKALAITSFLDFIVQVFKGFYGYALDNGYGQKIELDNSWIRLNSPDKIKYGGGIRVKRIVMNDNWSDASEYGQEYIYRTIDEETGNEISSGVAAYEPLAGGDEIALRTGKIYSEKKRFVNDNRYFFEYPINEGYYPGPQVGYSKVTVKSLATAKKDRAKETTDTSDDDDLAPSTTGVTINEFYTARDFPIITDETDVTRKSFKIYVPTPLGTVTMNHFAASQGYATELNDMHGKPKRVSSYAHDKKGNLINDPISSVQYNYKTKKRIINKKEVLVPDNKVPVIYKTANNTIAEKEAVMSEDFEFFVDMRQDKNENYTIQGKVDIDIILAFIPIPIPNSPPTQSYSSDIARTAVTNKIIHRSGILESVIATNGKSTVTTSNLKWDAQTGEVLLTEVTNNFEKKTYSYNIPAYFKYDGLGPAYKNIGLRFETRLRKTNNTLNYYCPESQSDFENLLTNNGANEFILVEGDRFIIDSSYKAIYVGKKDGKHTFYSESNLENDEDLNDFFLYRSGRANMLSAKIGSITSLAEPDVKLQAVDVDPNTVKIPKYSN